MLTTEEISVRELSILLSGWNTGYPAHSQPLAVLTTEEICVREITFCSSLRVTDVMVHFIPSAAVKYGGQEECI
jgi:hypothetical protein